MEVSHYTPTHCTHHTSLAYTPLAPLPLHTSHLLPSYLHTHTSLHFTPLPFASFLSAASFLLASSLLFLHALTCIIAWLRSSCGIIITLSNASRQATALHQRVFNGVSSAASWRGGKRHQHGRPGARRTWRRQRMKTIERKLKTKAALEERQRLSERKHEET